VSRAFRKNFALRKGLKGFKLHSCVASGGAIEEA
jgi:hypothetical protein